METNKLTHLIFEKKHMIHSNNILAYESRHMVTAYTSPPLGSCTLSDQQYNNHYSPHGTVASNASSKPTMFCIKSIISRVPRSTKATKSPQIYSKIPNAVASMAVRMFEVMDG